MKQLFIVLCLVLFSSKIYCQSGSNGINLRKQSLYIEIFGNTYGIIGLNYERIFHDSGNDLIHFTCRTGIGFDHRSIDSSGIINLPVEFTFLLGKRIHFLETGLGWTGSFGKYYSNDLLSPPVKYNSFGNVYLFRLGYRFTSNNGILVRAAPLLQLVDNPAPKLEVSFGLSIGLSFSSFRNIGARSASKSK